MKSHSHIRDAKKEFGNGYGHREDLSPVIFNRPSSEEEVCPSFPGANQEERAAKD